MVPIITNKVNQAAMELNNWEKKWGGKYPYAILFWCIKVSIHNLIQYPHQVRQCNAVIRHRNLLMRCTI